MLTYQLFIDWYSVQTLREIFQELLIIKIEPDISVNLAEKCLSINKSNLVYEMACHIFDANS